MRNNKNGGQALTALLVFMVVAITITTAAVAMIIASSQSAARLVSGESALAVAESGAENALLRLLRDTSYGGETLAVGTGTATVTVTGGATRTITSTGQDGNFVRRVQIVASYSNNILVVLSWIEG